MHAHLLMGRPSSSHASLIIAFLWFNKSYQKLPRKKSSKREREKEGESERQRERDRERYSQTQRHVMKAGSKPEYTGAILSLSKK
jgi:hypothetical protein